MGTATQRNSINALGDRGKSSTADYDQRLSRILSRIQQQTPVVYPGVINAMQFGVSPSASATVNAAGIQAAINFCGTAGGEIFVPRGTYSVASDIINFPHTNITITGAGSGMGYDTVTAGTTLVFTAGTLGFDCTAETGAGGAGNYTLLRYLGIHGNNLCAYPIKIKGVVLLEHLNVSGSTAAGAGIWLFDLVNSTRLSYVSSIQNNGYGIAIGGLGAGTASNTLMNMDGCTIRENLVGIRIEQAIQLTMRDSVIESNTHEGMQIYQRTGQVCAYLEFDNVHLENNWAGGSSSDFNLTIDSQTHDFASGPPAYIKFQNSWVIPTGSTGSVDVESARFARFDDCFFGGGAVLFNTYASYCGLWNENGAVLTNNGNRCWTGSDQTSLVGPVMGGPGYSNLSANQFAIPGTGTAVSCATGVATTVFAMPTSNQMRYFIVFAKLQSTTASATDYAAYAIIGADSTALILTGVNGANLAISLSGLNIQVNQSSGSTQNVEVSVTPYFLVV